VDSSSLVVWDTETGKPLPKVPLQKVSCAAFLPTGELVVCTTSKNTHICNAETGKPGPDLQKGRGQPAEAIAVSPDGRFLAQGGGQSVSVYDLVAKDFVALWTPFDAGVPRHVPVRLAFSPDGTKLVTGTSEVTNCFAVVWDLGPVLAKAKK
jgi:WD40 repeat protein